MRQHGQLALGEVGARGRRLGGRGAAPQRVLERPHLLGEVRARGGGAVQQVAGVAGAGAARRSPSPRARATSPRTITE